MLPSLNPDREGDLGDVEGYTRYQKHADELDALISAVRESYKTYGKTVKTRLTV